MLYLKKKHDAITKTMCKEKWSKIAEIGEVKTLWIGMIGLDENLTI